MGSRFAGQVYDQFLHDLYAGLYPAGGASGPIVSVASFNPAMDGVTDDSAAFHAAIASLPTAGGTVLFGTGPYAVNLTIARSRVCLRGTHIGTPSTATIGGLVPFDLAQPIVTLGDGTAAYHGLQLQNVELHDKYTGAYGLRIKGGVSSSLFENLTITGFLKKGLWIESSATLPITYCYFDGLLMQGVTSAAMEHGIYVAQGDAATYVEAIFFSNLRLSGLTVGWAVELAGTLSTTFGNSWMQLAHNHGIRLSQPFAVPSARLNGYGLQIDSGSSTDTLVSVGFGTGATDVISNYVKGFVSVDGNVDLNGTLRPNPSPLQVPNGTQLVFPSLIGSMYLTATSDPSVTTMTLSGNSATGVVSLTSTAGRISLSGTGSVQTNVDGVAVAVAVATGWRPFTDTTIHLGDASHRWADVYAVNATIQTSDAREKQDILPVDDAVLDAWAEVPVVQYRWQAAVAQKGAEARIHHGVLAQDIVATFAKHGLDAHRYGLLCYDAWDATDDRPAGDRYGIRPDQCAWLEAAWTRRALSRLTARGPNA